MHQRDEDFETSYREAELLRQLNSSLARLMVDPIRVVE